MANEVRKPRGRKSRKKAMFLLVGQEIIAKK